MSYRYEKLKELAWFAVVAAGTAVLMVLIEFDPEKITSWQTWAVSLGSGMIRAAAGAVIAALTVPARSDPVRAAEATVAAAEKTVEAVEQAEGPKGGL